MPVCQSFAPVCDGHSRILILGSMPGASSLAEQQYYAHPQNRFWRLLALLFDAPVPQDYAAKLALLRQNRTALWDTLARCERDGSLDSDISGEQPNDILGLLAEHPQIRAVFCNGGKAAAVFKKHFAGKMPPGVKIYYFHSTSPANARMSLADLAAEWQAVKNFI